MNILVVETQLQARMHNPRNIIAISSPTLPRETRSTLATDFKTYLLTFETVRAISEGNQTEEAYRQLRRSAPIYAKLLTDITDLDDLTGDLAEKAGGAGLQAVHDARNGAIGGVVLLAVVLTAMTAFTSRNILIPMRRLIGSINLLADGDLATDIPLTTRKDELGDVGRALEHFRANAIEKERLQKQERDDLEFARRIQLASVPRRFPAFPERPEIDICGRLAPTRAVGGDFFDFYLVEGSVWYSRSMPRAKRRQRPVAGTAQRAEIGGREKPQPGLTLATPTARCRRQQSMMFMTTFFGVLISRVGACLCQCRPYAAYLLAAERVVHAAHQPRRRSAGRGVSSCHGGVASRWRAAAYTDGVGSRRRDERLFGQQLEDAGEARRRAVRSGGERGVRLGSRILERHGADRRHRDPGHALYRAALFYGGSNSSCSSRFRCSGLKSSSDINQIRVSPRRPRVTDSPSYFSMV